MRSGTNRTKKKTFADLVFENNVAVIEFGEYRVVVIDTNETPKFVINVRKNGIPDGQFNYQTPENVTSLLKLVQSNVTYV